MKNFSVSVVIPNFNGRKLLEKNLPSLVEASQIPENHILEIIIVDDGSVDDSVKYLNRNYQSLKLIKHTKNRGFSAAVNTGVRMAKGNLVLLMNNDVAPEKNFLVPVFKHFDENSVFAVSLHEKGYGYAKGSFSAGFIELSMGEEAESACRSFYVSGGSGIFRRDYWMKLGGMDEKLFSPFYWEDIDLCYRAQKHGFINMWEPEAKVVHNHESTMSNFPQKYVQRIRERNRLLMIWKNIHSPKLVHYHVLGIARRLLHHPGYIRIILMALGKTGVVFKERRREIKLGKVSDEAIFVNFK